MEVVCEGECMGHCEGDESLTLMRYYSFVNPWKGLNPFVAKSRT